MQHQICAESEFPSDHLPGQQYRNPAPDECRGSPFRAGGERGRDSDTGDQGADLPGGVDDGSARRARVSREAPAVEAQRPVSSG